MVVPNHPQKIVRIMLQICRLRDFSFEFIIQIYAKRQLIHEH